MNINFLYGYDISPMHHPIVSQVTEKLRVYDQGLNDFHVIDHKDLIADFTRKRRRRSVRERVNDFLLPPEENINILLTACNGSRSKEDDELIYQFKDEFGVTLYAFPADGTSIKNMLAHAASERNHAIGATE